MPNQKRSTGAVPVNVPTFIPMTGNPENGDYLEWYRYLIATGQLDPPAQCKKRRKSN